MTEKIIKKYDLKKGILNKEVSLMNAKDVKNKAIKTIRDFAKRLKLNQFFTSIEILTQFYYLINLIQIKTL